MMVYPLSVYEGIFSFTSQPEQIWKKIERQDIITLLKKKQNKNSIPHQPTKTALNKSWVVEVTPTIQRTN